MTVFTDLQKLRCLERELKMRRKVYPKWVRDGRMDPAEADRQIAMMAEIMNEYFAKIPKEPQQDLLK